MKHTFWRKIIHTKKSGNISRFWISAALRHSLAWAKEYISHIGSPKIPAKPLIPPEQPNNDKIMKYPADFIVSND